MPSLNFQKQFVELIKNGLKCQTIRPLRKRPIKIGDRLFLFTGLRTKNCKRIRADVECKKIYDILIKDYNHIYLNGKLLTYAETKQLSIDDGFNNIKEFFEFFKNKYTLPFKGVLIKW